MWLPDIRPGTSVLGSLGPRVTACSRGRPQIPRDCPQRVSDTTELIPAPATAPTSSELDVFYAQGLECLARVWVQRPSHCVPRVS